MLLLQVQQQNMGIVQRVVHIKNGHRSEHMEITNGIITYSSDNMKVLFVSLKLRKKRKSKYFCLWKSFFGFYLIFVYFVNY